MSVNWAILGVVIGMFAVTVSFFLHLDSEIKSVRKDLGDKIESEARRLDGKIDSAKDELSKEITGVKVEVSYIRGMMETHLREGHGIAVPPREVATG